MGGRLEVGGVGEDVVGVAAAGACALMKENESPGGVTSTAEGDIEEIKVKGCSERFSQLFQ